MSERDDTPPRQYLAADDVLGTMTHTGARRIRDLCVLQILVLSTIGGGFSTMGALLSMLLARGVEAEAVARLGGPGWQAALTWNVLPAGLGNIVGGALLVVLPFWFALHPHERQVVSDSPKQGGRS